MATVKQRKQLNTTTAVLGACLSSDGKTAYAACLDGEIRRYDLESDASETLTRHNSYASGVKLCPSKNLLISAGYDGNLQWFDLQSKQLVRTIEAHPFWSWKLAVSPDEKFAASVSGQYLAGGYKYEPAKATEPTVKVHDVDSGEIAYAFDHTPPVQSVAISPDSKLLAAGNLMGEVSVWDLTTGERKVAWKSSDFTSWGIIKSHCYIGGVFAVRFSPDSQEVYAAGMGPMRDPMAGNGRQRWRKFRCSDGQTTGKSQDDQCGEGLMEALAFHPSGDYFVMAGRLRGGQWNAALFGREEGDRQQHLNTKYRITDADFSADGQSLLLAGATNQPKPDKNPEKQSFGRLTLFSVQDPAAEDEEPAKKKDGK